MIIGGMAALNPAHPETRNPLSHALGDRVHGRGRVAPVEADLSGAADDYQHAALAYPTQAERLADVLDPKDPTKVLVKAGDQLAGFGQLRDDGSTSCGCWIYSGAWTQAGNQMARRDNSDPSGLGNTLGWAWAWPPRLCRPSSSRSGPGTRSRVPIVRAGPAACWPTSAGW